MPLGQIKWAALVIVMTNGGVSLVEFLDELKEKGIPLQPETDFVEMYAPNFDFGECDVAGWRMEAAFLAGANLSQVRGIKQAFFSPKTCFAEAKLPPGVTAEELQQQVHP